VKLVDSPGESASALAREQKGVSSLEVILDSTSSEVFTGRERAFSPGW
jgi:hypothetical protein